MDEGKINDRTPGRKKYIVLGCASVLYWLLSFYLERFVFAPGTAEQHPFTYISVKLLTLGTIFALALFFYNALTGLRRRTEAAQTLLYFLPVFVCVTAFWAVCHSYPIQYGDQLNILDSAIYYSNMGGFFNYLTTYIPMIAMNIIPSGAFAVIFKIFLISLAAGYCVCRVRRLTSSWLAFLLYFPFLVPPGLYLSENIHRCPMYAVLYMLFSCVLLCDHLEKRSLTRGKFVVLSFMAAALTQWRSEGIYLLLLSPVLLYLAYRPRLTAGRKAMVTALMLAVQLIVFVPQKLETGAAAGGASERALPLFEYLITNMERKGLDKVKNAEELAIVDRYVSVDAIHALNEQNGDYNYNDNLIIYHGLRKDATQADKDEFKAAVIRLVLKNPGVYLRTQLGAWAYISTERLSDRRLDVISNIFQDLFIPTAWLIAVWIYSLARKDWLVWFLTSGHLCHMAITTLLLPAAYFKYFYSEYLYAFLTLTLLLPIFLKGRKNQQKAAESLY